MLERIRRQIWGKRSSVPQGPSTAKGASSTLMASVLQTPRTNHVYEGVYAGYGNTLHYVLDGASKTRCGRPLKGLHRWASGWYFTEPKERCKRCDTLVGERGNSRHGPITAADITLFGVTATGEAPPDPRGHLAALSGEVGPGWAEGEFVDPPFVYDKDPNRRRAPLESTYNRVMNDVYTRMRSGKKWHRVYETHTPSRDPVLAPYGKSFLFPCGNSGSEFDRDEKGGWYEPPLRTEVPPAEEICRACAQSDAKYGRGEILRNRWDR